MSNYVFAYFGAKRPEDGARHMKRWRAWVGGLGDAMVNPGTFLGTSKTVGSGGATTDSGADRLCGYSIVAAESMDAALEMVKECPHLDLGTIEVVEVMEM